MEKSPSVGGGASYPIPVIVHHCTVSVRLSRHIKRNLLLYTIRINIMICQEGLFETTSPSFHLDITCSLEGIEVNGVP